METSALTNFNVRNVFENLVQKIYNVKSIEGENGNKNQDWGKGLVHIDATFDKKKKSCWSRIC
jgi:hypothetical protein